MKRRPWGSGPTEGGRGLACGGGGRSGRGGLQRERITSATMHPFTHIFPSYPSKSSSGGRPCGGGGRPKGGNRGGVLGRERAAICASASSRLNGRGNKLHVYTVACQVVVMMYGLTHNLMINSRKL